MRKDCLCPGLAICFARVGRGDIEILWEFTSNTDKCQPIFRGFPCVILSGWDFSAPSNGIHGPAIRRTCGRTPNWPCCLLVKEKHSMSGVRSSKLQGCLTQQVCFLHLGGHYLFLTCWCIWYHEWYWTIYIELMRDVHNTWGAFPIPFHRERPPSRTKLLVCAERSFGWISCRQVPLTSARCL